MGSKRVDSYYTSRKRLLVVEFDLAARVARKVVAAHYGDRFTDAIAVEARQEYESLTPQLPYIGGRENPLTQIMVAAGMFLALYKPLKAHGKAVEEIGALVYEAVERAYDLFPRSLLRLYGRLSLGVNLKLGHPLDDLVSNAQPHQPEGERHRYRVFS
jgi:hypothetical protein